MESAEAAVVVGLTEIRLELKMKSLKFIVLSGLLTLSAAATRADVATLAPAEPTVTVSSSGWLDGSTTIENAAASKTSGVPNAYGKITISTCTWYRPCYQPPQEPITLTTQSELVTTHAPEPASLALFGSGLLGIGALVRRKMRANRDS